MCFGFNTGEIFPSRDGVWWPRGTVWEDGLRVVEKASDPLPESSQFQKSYFPQSTACLSAVFLLTFLNIYLFWGRAQAGEGQREVDTGSEAGFALTV